MAEVKLKNVKKIYPHSETKKKPQIASASWTPAR